MQAQHCCVVGAGGRKRRKVTKTSYNDKGEEITEVLWEEEAAAEPAAAEPAAAAGSAHVGSQAEANSDANGSMALRERQANEPAVSEGNSGQAAKKASSPKKASKPVGKAVGKGSSKVRHAAVVFMQSGAHRSMHSVSLTA